MNSAKNVIATFTESDGPSLKILSATYATDYSTEDGTPAICDNKVTTLTYRFLYEGPLESWTSYLEGQTLGEVKGRRTFTSASEGVVDLNEEGFEVQYVMSPNFAPYVQESGTLLKDAISPLQAPQVIGATKLYLIIEGAGQEAGVESEDIPVISNRS